MDIKEKLTTLPLSPGVYIMKDKSNTTNPKDDVEATVTQNKTEWKFNEFETIGNGLISAEGLTSGNWQGSFYFRGET